PPRSGPMATTPDTISTPTASAWSSPALVAAAASPTPTWPGNPSKPSALSPTSTPRPTAKVEPTRPPPHKQHSSYPASRLSPASKRNQTIVTVPVTTGSAGEPLLLDRDGPAAVLTINRPERLNALTYRMFARLP